MSSPITHQPAHAASPPEQHTGVCPLPPDGWACSQPSGHEGPCVASPVGDQKSSAGDVVASESPRKYGFGRAQEFDLQVPSGGTVRFRKPTWAQILDADLGDVVDGFSAELLKGVDPSDPESEKAAEENLGKALLNREKRHKMLGPMDRIAAVAVICPKVVLEGETTDDQINVSDIDLPDKMAIFFAAVGEQIDHLKSLGDQKAPRARDLPQGNNIQPATE